MVFVNTEEQPHRATAMWSDADKGVEIPAIVVRRSEGELIWARLDDGEEVTIEDVALTREAAVDLPRGAALSPRERVHLPGSRGERSPRRGQWASRATTSGSPLDRSRPSPVVRRSRSWSPEPASIYRSARVAPARVVDLSAGGSSGGGRRGRRLIGSP